MQAKVRRVAGEFPELGRIRHVESNPPSPTAWLVTLVFIALCATVAGVGTASAAEALALVPAWLVIGLVILWYLGGEKVVVLDRGLLIGSFAPFLRPYVVPFERFAVDSITAVRPGWKLSGLFRGRTSLSTGRTAVWAWNAVAFVAEHGPVARRKDVDAARTFSAQPVRRDSVVWWFGTWRQPDRLVGALESALVDLGHPVAGLSQQVLPLVHLTGKQTDTAQVPRLVTAVERTS